MCTLHFRYDCVATCVVWTYYTCHVWIGKWSFLSDHIHITCLYIVCSNIMLCMYACMYMYISGWVYRMRGSRSYAGGMFEWCVVITPTTATLFLIHDDTDGNIGESVYVGLYLPSGGRFSNQWRLVCVRVCVCNCMCYYVAIIIVLYGHIIHVMYG